MAPSPRAEPRTLVRRLYHDLLGLPPTFEQVQAFEENPTQEAFAQLVDRLLDSEHFGERWARHWLDVARFGDTKGYVFREDRNYPHAYKYRDWVIQALNGDMPFDQFLKYQIAADHLISRGVEADRITVKGEGETNPIADNDTPEGRARNRRIEIQTRYTQRKYPAADSRPP